MQGVAHCCVLLLSGPRCGFEPDISLSTLAMLTSIEVRLEECLTAVEALPAAQVSISAGMVAPDVDAACSWPAAVSAQHLDIPFKLKASSLEVLEAGLLCWQFSLSRCCSGLVDSRLTCSACNL